MQCAGATLAERAEAWARRVRALGVELTGIQAEIDRLGFDLYGLSETDRRAIAEGFGGAETGSLDVDADGAGDGESEARGGGGGEERSAADSNVVALTAELVSWAVGVAFGRFDVRLATGARRMPGVPAPFDALPVCSPAMLAGDDGLPLARAPVGYPLTLPEDGILVDDPGHPLDLTAAVRAVFEVVFGNDAEARWREAAALLDPGGREIRTWLSRRFFEHHLRAHSGSRRKAPIFWQLATEKGGYSVWMYAHRVDGETLSRVQGLVEGRREREPSVELQAMVEEIELVSAVWRPDLDDGVAVTLAPLWRLVPQNKGWQRELKASWDRLAAGKVDWAKVAMHLWPERVLGRCAEDRSLALAHGVEERFWEEEREGKWRARAAPGRAVE
jgi:uncharacterized protein (DUF934 family)